MESIRTLALHQKGEYSNGGGWFLYQYKCAAPDRNDISDLDPNGIQSIEVLKDALATAVYGSRGVE